MKLRTTKLDSTGYAAKFTSTSELDILFRRQLVFICTTSLAVREAHLTGNTGDIATARWAPPLDSDERSVWVFGAVP